MKRTITKLLSLVLVLSMLMTTAPVINTANAGGGGQYNLTVTPGCGFNLLEWEVIPGAAHYWIYRGPGPGQEYATPLTDFPISETQFKDTINIQNGQLYCYFVKGVDANAEEFAQTIEACGTPNCFEDDECKLVLKYQQDNAKYWVNDVEKGPMETPTVNVNNRLFLVVRYVTQEIAGTTIVWKQSEQKVTITTRDNHVIELWIGQSNIRVDGVLKPIDPNNPAVVPYLSEGRSMMPMRVIAENLGATGPNDIKWFGDTKMVELRFDDPECDDCEWVTGEIINTIYHAGSTPVAATTNIMPHWEVEFMACNGTLHLLYSQDDIADENGVNPLSEYTGCAELCIINGVVTKLKSRTDLEPCCPNRIPVYPICTTIEGEIIRTGYNSSEGLWEIKFKKCDGTFLTIFAEEDLPSLSYPLSQYRGCAEICISNHLIISWTAFPDKDNCCGNDEEPDCRKIEGEIMYTLYNESEGLWEIKFKKCDNTFLTIFAETDLISGSFPLSQYRGCAEICIANHLIISWTAFPDKDNCCGNDEEPDCRKIEGEIIYTIAHPDTENWEIKFRKCDDTYLTLWADSNLLSGNYPLSRYKGCAEVCIDDGVIFSWIAYPDKDDCCGEEEPMPCICITVIDSTTNGVLGKDADGNEWILTFADSGNLGKMNRGECWKVCGKIIPPTTTSDSLTKKMNVVKMLKVECPCGTEIKEVCMCFTVERVSCDTKPQKVYGSDENGNKWVLYLDNVKECLKMKIGSCWRLCANFTGKNEGQFRVLKQVNAEPTTCPCVPEDEEKEICVCVEIVRTACDGEVPLVYTKDKDGKTWVLFLENDDVCGMMQVGTYWDVCGYPAGVNGNSKAIKVSYYKQRKLPCGEDNDCEKIVKGIVKDSNSDYLTMDLEVNGKIVKFKTVKPGLHRGVKVGDCIEVCIKRGDVIFTIKKLDPKECEESNNDCNKILKGEVVDIGCTAYGYLKLKLNNGDIRELTVRDIDVCDWVKVGDCVMVCLKTDDSGKVIVDWMDKLPPASCEDNTEEVCICATILKSYCGLDRPYVLVQGERGNKWILFLDDKYDCEKLKPGTCWSVCGTVTEGRDGLKGVKLTYFEQVECPCKSKEVELCVTVEDPACHGDDPKVYVKLASGKQIVLYFDNTYECETMKQGECWEVHGSWFFDEQAGAVGFSVASMEKTDCPCKTSNETYKEYDVIILDRNCDMRIPFYTVVFKGHLYKVYLPKDFDCHKYRDYQCITVKGTLNDKNITAVNIKDRTCGITGLYGCTVVATYCDSGYMEVKYGEVIYKFYYPPYFDCSSVSTGDCLTFRGMIYTSGIIKEVSIVKKTPCHN